MRNILIGVSMLAALILLALFGPVKVSLAFAGPASLVIIVSALMLIRSGRQKQSANPTAPATRRVTVGISEETVRRAVDRALRNLPDSSRTIETSRPVRQTNFAPGNRVTYPSRRRGERLGEIVDLQLNSGPHGRATIRLLDCGDGQPVLVRRSLASLALAA